MQQFGPQEVNAWGCILCKNVKKIKNFKNMDGNPRTSKHSINLAAEHHFGGNVDGLQNSKLNLLIKFFQ